MVTKVSPSLIELNNILSLEQLVKKNIGLTDEGLSKALGVSQKNLMRVIQLRTARLSRLFSTLERERLKCLKNIDIKDLRHIANSPKMRLLEKLVNDYFLLSEGLMIDKTKIPRVEKY